MQLTPEQLALMRQMAEENEAANQQGGAPLQRVPQAGTGAEVADFFMGRPGEEDLGRLALRQYAPAALIGAGGNINPESLKPVLEGGKRAGLISRMTTPGAVGRGLSSNLLRGLGGAGLRNAIGWIPHPAARILQAALFAAPGIADLIASYTTPDAGEADARFSRGIMETGAGAVGSGVGIARGVARRVPKGGIKGEGSILDLQDTPTGPRTTTPPPKTPPTGQAAKETARETADTATGAGPRTTGAQPKKKSDLAWDGTPISKPATSGSELNIRNNVLGAVDEGSYRIQGAATKPRELTPPRTEITDIQVRRGEKPIKATAPQLLGWLAHHGTQPGMTKAKMIQLLSDNKKFYYPADLAKFHGEKYVLPGRLIRNHLDGHADAAFTSAQWNAIFKSVRNVTRKSRSTSRKKGNRRRK